MSVLKRILRWLVLHSDPGPRYYHLDQGLALTVRTLAEHEGRSQDEMAAGLLAAGLDRYYSADELWQHWQSLTGRERDAAALACLGYTNRQIAVRLGISAETVKTHLRNALAKFGLHSRSELHLLLVEWDFSAWDR